MLRHQMSVEKAGESVADRDVGMPSPFAYRVEMGKVLLLGAQALAAWSKLLSDDDDYPV